MCWCLSAVLHIWWKSILSQCCSAASVLHLKCPLSFSNKHSVRGPVGDVGPFRCECCFRERARWVWSICGVQSRLVFLSIHWGSSSSSSSRGCSAAPQSRVEDNRPGWMVRLPAGQHTRVRVNWRYEDGSSLHTGERRVGLLTGAEF